MEYTKHAIVSMSGGLDSTCLALHLLSRGYEVKAFGFDYGQSHKVELRRARSNVKYLQKLGFPITYEIINLRSVFKDSTASLVTHETSPEGHYEDETMRVTVVENRNIIFSACIYSRALAWSKQLQDDVVIALGVHAGDHAIYPDCTPESVEMSQKLYKISNWGSEKVDYRAPFVNLTKAGVLEVGIQAMKSLGLTRGQINRVLRYTISCYNADSHGTACGKCGTCTERLEAFEANSLKDPVKYR